MGGLDSPGNIDELADRLDVLLSDAAMRVDFGAAAKLRASNEYRASVVAEKTVEVYRNVMQ